MNKIDKKLDSITSAITASAGAGVLFSSMGAKISIVASIACFIF